MDICSFLKFSLFVPHMMTDTFFKSLISASYSYHHKLRGQLVKILFRSRFWLAWNWYMSLNLQVSVSTVTDSFLGYSDWSTIWRYFLEWHKLFTYKNVWKIHFECNYYCETLSMQVNDKTTDLVGNFVNNKMHYNSPIKIWI